MLSPSPTFAFSCVSEGRADWFRKVRNLVVSVRSNGGAAKHSRIVVNVVGRVDRQIWNPLEKWDVELRSVEPFDIRFPHANKLRMFDHADVLAGCDVLVALDCDIIIASDPAPLLGSVSVRAKPEDQTILADSHWHLIYDAMGIAPPEKNCVMTSSGELSYPWWNSGVVGVPSHLAAELRLQWGKNIGVVAGLHEKNLLPANWITDQIGFVCALLQLDLPFDPLPITGNFPTCFPVHDAVRLASPGPAVFIHYHHHLASSGLLKASGDQVIDTQVDAFNRSLAETLSLDYPGLLGVDRPPTAVDRSKAALQARLKRFSWYRSPRLRPMKAWATNLVARVRDRSRGGDS